MYNVVVNNKQHERKNMITRNDYISGKASHREYYAQFVTPSHFAALKSMRDRIMKSTDPHFNDIALKWWDSVSVACPTAKMKECGDYPTLAGSVCILKEAARQMKEKENANV
jgi:hypothetical protein